MKKKMSSCTAMLVGKNATIDGSTIIARDEDAEDGVNPKTFKVFPAKDYTGEHYVSKYNGLTVDMEGQGCRFTATPNGVPDEGRWDEQGINEYNVAMSSTETEMTNARVLGHDPLVTDGVNEDSMLYLVLPFIKSAREGVQRLGHLIEKYGTGETNGIAFSDHDEVWYLETAGGHQWVAQRIPDDAYAIAPNIMCIEEIDFDDPDNYMYASGIQEFVEKFHLNPNPGSFNFRNIFGTQDEADAYYNTPRSWYGQKLFTPSLEQDPTSQNIPFIQHAEKKIAVEDVEQFLSSHYNGTPYDPMGTYASGTPEEQRKFRSIALDRNQSSCILQIRNDVPAEYAAIQWINFGFYCYSPYVPFFTNINDTPANYQVATNDADPDKSAYWMHKLLEVIVEPRYHEFINEVNDFRDGCQSYGVGRVDAITAGAAGKHGEELTDYLTAANKESAAHVTAATHQLMSSLIHQALLNSKFQFERGDNL
ncbi:C69 family dipeptidase [Limosilactobacillus sp.]|uniref:C69 family dipeptidase n=1 Tax=Limosilactobacillus sp. TaxID=2773925 RepID=UPI003EFBE388